MHDYETFGTNPQLDDASQFAALRVNEKMEALGEPTNIFCQPSADSLPHPMAVLITGVTPQAAYRKGLTEFEFAKRIFDEVTQPGTCTVGFNSGRFDDKFTINLFYRNFLDMYAWTWKDGCSKWDIIDLLRAYQALRPEGVIWPRKEDGKLDFRLESFTAANGIEHSNSHEALSDVEASISTCNILKKSNPKMFDYFFDKRRKRELQNLVDLAAPTPLVYVSGILGTKRNCLTVVLPIGYVNGDNQLICIDLVGDVEQLKQPGEEIKAALYSKRKSETPRPPLLKVELNKCPILAPLNVLRQEDCQRLDIDVSGAVAKAELFNNPELKSKLLSVYTREDKAKDEQVYIETRTYDGFFSNDDRKLCQQFLELSPSDMASFEFPEEADPRLSELRDLFVCRNFPKNMTRRQKSWWKERCAKRISEQLPEFNEAMVQARQEYAAYPDKQQLLDDLEAHVEKLKRDAGLNI